MSLGVGLVFGIGREINLISDLVHRPPSWSPYFSPNLPDKSEFAYFFMKDLKSCKFVLQIIYYWVLFSWMVVFLRNLTDFGLRAPILTTLRLRGGWETLVN